MPDPQEKTAIISGDGGYQYDLPDDWQEGFSYIISVIYPADDILPRRLEAGDYAVYKSPGGLKLHFFQLTPQPTETIRITYA